MNTDPDPSITRPPDLLRSIARLGIVVLSALLMLSCLDAIRIALAPRVAIFAVGNYWLYSCVLAGLVSLVLALSLGALSYLARGLARRIASERVQQHLAVHANGALAASAAYLVLRPWNFYTDRYHSALIVPLATWFGVACLRFCAGVLPRRIYVTGALLATALLVLCDALVLRGLYRTFHNVAALAALICAAHAVSALLPEFSLKQSLRALSSILLAVPLLLSWGDNRVAREVASLNGLVLPRLIALIAPLADRDGDGFAPIFAGDCDDGDPDVHPGACELPKNQRDDNCNGHVDIAPVIATAPQANNWTPPSPAPDVYLIVVDALRADFARQERKRAMPLLDRFAAQALDFEQAYTAYPSTHRAMMALSTSRSHRYRSAAIPAIPSWLHQAGYEAQVWVGKRRLRERTGAPPTVGAERETSDPFEVRRDGKTEWSAAIVDDAIAELGVAGPRAPRFRWLHLLDTHSPWLRGGDSASARERYRAEIAFVDVQLGRLFEALARDPAGSRAVVVVLADHGEELGEHGDVFHGAALWQSSIRVPLIMRLPGTTSRSERRVSSLIDVVPTLASYLGLPRHPAWQGHDWLSRVAPPSARVVSEVEPIDNAGSVGIPARLAAVTSALKLIVNVDEQLSDVYDVAHDPDELVSLAGREGIAERRVLESVIAVWEDGDGCVSETR